MPVLLQEVADTLADELACPVALDDVRLRLLAHSAHSQPMDRVRRQSIVERQSPKDVIALVRKLQLERAPGAVRIPSETVPGMKPRVCVPFRTTAGRLLGFLWVTEERPLSDDDLRLIETAAADAAVAFEREVADYKDWRDRDRRLIESLTDSSKANLDSCRAEVERNGLSYTDPAVVLVLKPARTDQSPRLAGDLRIMRNAFDGEPTLAAELDDHAVVIGSLKRTHLETVSAALHRSERLRSGAAGWIGVGSRAAGLTQAATSYRDARKAIAIGSRLERDGAAISNFESLGFFKLLASLAPNDIERLIHPGVVALSAEPTLVATLNIYLGVCGDAQHTAAQLGIHRSTLYYRLSRIREITGIDLNDGDERLDIHASLKMMELRE